jgi:alkylation response protein AidB-like acyl-CoA dehydrogenase
MSAVAPGLVGVAASHEELAMTMTTISATPTLAEAARMLAPRIRAAAWEADVQRRLPDNVVEALRQAHLFRMYLPRQLGGDEVDPLTTIRVVEELATADGSAAWIVQVANQAAWVWTALPKSGGQEMFGSDPDVITNGVGAPAGRAVEVEGGYRVTGRWAFGSGIIHATWMGGNCQVMDGDTPRRADDGTTVTRFVLFPRADCEVIDTWHTTGLRGSGSHDFAVHDLFVPFHRSFAFGVDKPRYPGPLYRARAFWLALRGALAIGVAARAIEELVALAGGKTPAQSRTVLREHVRVQDAVARAHARLSAARCYLHRAVGDAWETACAGASVSRDQQLEMRVANNHAMDTAVEVVTTMYHLGGGTAIYATSALDRCFRDVNTAAADVIVSPRVYENAGRVLLGLEPEPGVF